MNPTTATFDELREWLGDVIKNNPNSGKLWDLITCLRGPDSPSETPEMSGTAHQKAYNARRKRKRQTVEVIRGKAFFGAVSGSARSRNDISYVTLPPEKEWDHFDKHVARAAGVLGLEIKYLKPRKQRKKDAGEPAWEILVEGKANGVPMKKDKVGQGGNYATVSYTKAAKIPSWPVTKENLDKIDAVLSKFPHLSYVGVDVALGNAVYTITGPEFEKAKKSFEYWTGTVDKIIMEIEADDSPF